MSVADSFSWSPRDYTCSVPMPSDLVTSRASRPKPSNTQADTSSCDGATSSTPEQVVVTWEYRQGSGDWADLSTSGLKLVCTCLHLSIPNPHHPHLLPNTLRWPEADAAQGRQKLRVAMAKYPANWQRQYS